MVSGPAPAPSAESATREAPAPSPGLAVAGMPASPDLAAAQPQQAGGGGRTPRVAAWSDHSRGAGGLDARRLRGPRPLHHGEQLLLLQASDGFFLSGQRGIPASLRCSMGLVKPAQEVQTWWHHNTQKQEHLHMDVSEQECPGEQYTALHPACAQPITVACCQDE